MPKIKDAYNRSPEKRFWGKVIKHKSGCWEWIGNTIRGGYGRIHFAGKNRLAHRVAWFLTYGYWPKDKLLHDCDNPPCIRPEHLYEGSQLDNVRDCIARRRFKPTGAIGVNHGHARLNPAKVRIIRFTNLPDRVWAERFNVTKVTITSARLGIAWKWLTDPAPVRRNV